MPDHLGTVDEKVLIKRASMAWEKKRLGRTMREDAFRYTTPNRLVDDAQWYSPNEEKTRGVYDATGVIAAKRFAGRMTQGLTPPFERWVSLRAGLGTEEKERPAAQRILDAVNTALFQATNISGFNTASHEMYMDLHVGTGILYVNENSVLEKTPFTVVSVPEATVALDSGPFNKIEGVFRRHEVVLRNIEPTWPGAKIPAEMKDRDDEEGASEKKYKLIECTYLDRGVKPRKEDGDLRPWIHKVLWCEEKAGSEPQVIWEKAYHENPFIVVRWSVLTGEDEGRGPSLDALPDLRTLNKVTEVQLKGAALSLVPPFMVLDDGVTNPRNMRVEPGAFITVARTAGPNGPSIAPIPTGQRYDLSSIMVDRLQENIKKVLFDDQLPPQAGSVRSATEIIERIRQLNEDVGGVLGRLHDELVVPFVRRALGVMFRRGEIPKIEVDGIGVEVVIESPLARTQDLRDVQNLSDYMALISQFTGFQGLGLALKLEDVLTDIGRLMGVQEKHLRSDEDKQALMQMVAQLLAQTQNPTEALTEGAGNQGPGGPAGQIATRGNGEA